MNIHEAYQRFEQWPTRDDLPITSTGGRPTRDMWTVVATGAVQLMDRLDSATTDDDLRDALREWVALRETDPLSVHESALDGRLRLAASEIMATVFYPEHRGRASDLPAISLHHEIHLHRRIVEVTPTLARAILDMEEATRGVELQCPEGCIVRFGGKIQAHEWLAVDPNPTTAMRITARHQEDTEGNLTGEIEFAAGPGEHRLQSIVNAGVTVDVEFVAPFAAFDAIEQLAAKETVTA